MNQAGSIGTDAITRISPSGETNITNVIGNLLFASVNLIQVRELHLPLTSTSGIKLFFVVFFVFVFVFCLHRARVSSFRLHLPRNLYNIQMERHNSQHTGLC